MQDMTHDYALFLVGMMIFGLFIAGVLGILGQMHGD